jgi:toxin-antitoxin system PIN domain toxin
VILPDVNVLVDAVRKEASQHARCKAWLNAVVAGESAFALSPLVLAAVVRVATNPVFNISTEDAFSFCDNLLGQPHARIVEPGPDHWMIFQRLCRDTPVRGKDVTDAWYAALAIESGCEWITLDRGFARFSGLKWSMPSPG